jgi:hypothetical protein
LARAMATAMRVVGEEEGKGGKGNGNLDKGSEKAMALATKRTMAMATRVVGKQQQQEGNGDGNEGGGQGGGLC